MVAFKEGGEVANACVKETRKLPLETPEFLYCTRIEREEGVVRPRKVAVLLTRGDGKATLRPAAGCLKAKATSTQVTLSLGRQSVVYLAGNCRAHGV